MSDNEGQVNTADQSGETDQDQTMDDQQAAEKQQTTEKQQVAPEPSVENKTEPAVSSQDKTKGDPIFDASKLGILNEVYISLSIEIGRAQIKIRDLLNLNKGSIIELDKLAGEPVDVFVNGKLVSTGNIITSNGKYCVRLSSINKDQPLGVEGNGK